MKKTIFFFAIIGLFLMSINGCTKKPSDASDVKETAVAGSTTILVDETIFPLVEDVAILFENEYKRAKVTLISKSETEIIQMIQEDKSRIAVLAKTLDSTEMKYYNNTKKVYPRITEFGKDALAFIGNGSIADSTIVLNDVLNVLRGNANSKIKTLVFDNPNSSTVRELKTLAGIKELPKQNVFSVHSNKEVVKYVTENKGAIGIIGINWLLQPSNDLTAYLPKIQVLAVENVKVNEKNKFVKPNQTNIADGSYPVTRKLYMLNFQGSTGLGMGFASYIAGQQGQRIILKSGLVPKHFPTRQVSVRNEVE
ncbi:PstS family phosphate ABC transporter substrate-binding protein [Flavobacterium saliperosum]|uniref:Phosphate transport system substrate-binding protein n=2 Tax=Flavobacterium saliperosum TaxID=329186 RepID=A0A1G4VUZ5_9FLAO|nr:substrate-binding domain-containing protein [Flavobacterium saliperosum]SCX12364.1 phosphate transport system substrate-binding protein [Flavobacterium saliperosum]